VAVPDFLILAHRDDATARAVAAAVASRHGPGAVRVVYPAELSVAVWSHRLDSSTTSTNIVLPRPPPLASSDIGAVFNRLRLVDAVPFGRAADREYATLETFALVLSWLSSLPCAVINPAQPRGLAGALRGDAEWLALARSCGLAIRGMRVTSNARRFAPRDWAGCTRDADPTTDGSRVELPAGERPAQYFEPAGLERRRVLVAGDAVRGAPTRESGQACRALSAQSACPLLEVVLGRRPGPVATWSAEHVDAFPSASDETDVSLIADLLEVQIPRPTAALR
jgi:hypothetical protein